MVSGQSSLSGISLIFIKLFFIYFDFIHFSSFHISLLTQLHVLSLCLCLNNKNENNGMSLGRPPKPRSSWPDTNTSHGFCLGVCFLFGCLGFCCWWWFCWGMVCFLFSSCWWVVEVSHVQWSLGGTRAVGAELSTLHALLSLVLRNCVLQFMWKGSTEITWNGFHLIDIGY